MINEFSIFGKKKNQAIPIKRIKELFSQFGFIIFKVDDYTGFLSRPPYDIRFAPVEYKDKIGTRLTYKIGDSVQEDSIYFHEHDILEFLYQNSNTIRRGHKVLEDTFQEDLLRFLHE